MVKFEKSRNKRETRVGLHGETRNLKKKKFNTVAKDTKKQLATSSRALRTLLSLSFLKMGSYGDFKVNNILPLKTEMLN